MRHFVRSHEFPGDNYTSYWCGGRHEWTDLGSATVFTETEMKSFSGTKVTLDHNGSDYYVPSEGRWQELPLRVRTRTSEEMDEAMRLEQETYR
jgi:hypothetical protein